MSWSRIDQRRWEAVEALVRRRPDIFARQGTVRTAGPYFDLCYRDRGVQRSIYLGPSRALAGRVAALLDSLHAAEQQRRLMRRLLRRARKGLRRRLAEFDALLARCGASERAFEIRDDELFGADLLEDDLFGDDLLDDVRDVDVRDADVRDADACDADVCDADAASLDRDQDPQDCKTHRTGGKGCAREKAVFDDALTRSSQDAARKLLAARATLLRMYAKSNNSRANNPGAGESADGERS